MIPTSPSVTRAIRSAETAAVLGGGPAQAEIDIDDLDVGLRHEIAGALARMCRRRLSWLLRTWCGWDWRM